MHKILIHSKITINEWIVRPRKHIYGYKNEEKRLRIEYGGTETSSALLATASSGCADDEGTHSVYGRGGLVAPLPPAEKISDCHDLLSEAYKNSLDFDKEISDINNTDMVNSFLE